MIESAFDSDITEENVKEVLKDLGRLREHYKKGRGGKPSTVEFKYWPSGVTLAHEKKHLDQRRRLVSEAVLHEGGYYEALQEASLDREEAACASEAKRRLQEAVDEARSILLRRYFELQDELDDLDAKTDNAWKGTESEAYLTSYYELGRLIAAIKARFDIE